MIGRLATALAAGALLKSGEHGPRVDVGTPIGPRLAAQRTKRHVGPEPTACCGIILARGASQRRRVRRARHQPLRIRPSHAEQMRAVRARRAAAAQPEERAPPRA